MAAPAPFDVVKQRVALASDESIRNEIQALRTVARETIDAVVLADNGTAERRAMARFAEIMSDAYLHKAVLAERAGQADRVQEYVSEAAEYRRLERAFSGPRSVA